MKHSCLIIFILLALQAASQRFGIKAGLSLASYTAQGIEDTNPMSGHRTNVSASLKPGILIGAFWDFNLSTGSFFRSGVELVSKGGNEKGTYIFNGISYPYNEKKGFTAFDFPLVFLFKKRLAGVNIFAGAGVVPGILVETGLNRFDLGANFLAGCELLSGWMGSLSYNHGLIDVAPHSFDYKTLKNRTLSFTLGYSFLHSKPQNNETFTTSGFRSLYMEAGGPSGVLSINFDQRFSKQRIGLGLRVGIGTVYDPYYFGFSLPLALNYLTGKKAHWAELAVGASLFHFKEKNQDSWYNFKSENFLSPFLWAGYRYQSTRSRFMCRAGFTHFFNSGMPPPFRFPYPTISFGYLFP